MGKPIQGQPNIWIKHADGKIADRDTVYCVRIADGRLRLFARVEVDKKARDEEDPNMLWHGRHRADTWAGPTAW